ncbi:MAG TPA: c-type cytochrome [Candidatus Eisenbacteria bacterium]
MNSPGPSSDRLWFWFGVSSVTFLLVLAISPIKDYFREYRRYQNEYRQRLLHSAASLKELKQAQTRGVGVRQIWLPALDNHVDRCVSCHLGVEEPRMAGAPEPFRQHPRTPHTPGDLDRFGCVACHLGQGRATTVAEAHGRVPDWSSPILPVRYTEAACGRCHPGDTVPEASLLSEGRGLMARVGCFGCHKVAGHEGWKSEAPDLAGLSQKTNPAWLAAWIRSPRSLRPSTWMPDFLLTAAEIDSVVAFLWSRPPRVDLDAESTAVVASGNADHGKLLFSTSRCISCHTVEGRGNGSAPELSGVGSKVSRRWLVAFLADPQRFYPDTKMPRYHFGGSDVADLADYMIQEFTDASAPAPAPGIRSADRVVQAGEAIFRRAGCNGCHQIGGHSQGAAIGPELTGIGDKPVGRLDFGRRDDLPRRLPDWLAAKITNPRSFRDGLKMPRFGFTEHETDALTTALLSIGRVPVPVAYQVPVHETSYTPPGHFGELVRQYRCMSCHQIGGVGGDISTAPLTAEGSKVRESWLAGYLKLPTTVRPILEERMIQLQMPDDQRTFIASFVENVLRNDSIPGEILPAASAAEEVERGRKLFHERYGCQACHMIGGRGGFYGPVLDGAGQRLKTGWIYSWLKAPQRWRADAREPDYGLDDADARALTAYVASIPPLTVGHGAATSAKPAARWGEKRR